MSDDDILTIEEVAKYLRVSNRTIYEWATHGVIPAGKIGNVWRFNRMELEKWVSSKINAPVQVKERKRKDASAAVKLASILTLDRIIFLPPCEKEEAIRKIAKTFLPINSAFSEENLTKEFLAREGIMTTSIGRGIAVPHICLKEVKNIACSIAISKSGVFDKESLDGKPINIYVAFLTSNKKHNQYLSTLSEIIGKLKDATVKDNIINASNSSIVFNLLKGKD